MPMDADAPLYWSGVRYSRPLASISGSTPIALCGHLEERLLRGALEDAGEMLHILVPIVTKMCNIQRGVCAK